MSKTPPAKPKIDFCSDQIQRMSGLEYAGALDFMAIRELASTLRDISETEEHAARIITRYLREGGYVDSDTLRRVHKIPTPYQLAEFAKDMSADPILEMQSGGLPPGCEECNWTGWRTVSRKRFDTIVMREVEVTGTARCICPRGQRLSEMDRARMATAVAK